MEDIPLPDEEYAGSDYNAFEESAPAPDFDARLKVVPHSIEAEQAVLGGLMLAAGDQTNAWDMVSDVLGASDFYRADHRLLFETMSGLVANEQPIDVVTVADQLQAKGELDRAGGLPYLAELADNTPSTANIRAYATIVREKATLRQLIATASDIVDRAYDSAGQSSDELLESAEGDILRIRDERPNEGGPQYVNPVLEKTLTQIDELFHSDSAITGVTTGFERLDDMTSGLQRSNLVIVAGRPSMGKCIVAGSKLVDPASGQLRTIDELVAKKSGEVLSLDNSFRLAIRTPCQFVDDGKKPVFKVTTALGRSIETTLTHPFLTGTGWRPLENIDVGEAVAVPRELPIFGSKRLEEHKIKALAYFIADGGTTQGSPLFTNTNPAIVSDFIEAMQCFNGISVHAIEDPERAPSFRVSGRNSNPGQLRRIFSQLLNESLQRLHLSGKVVARKLQLNSSTISQWRNAHAVPSTASYDCLCGLLDSEFKTSTHAVYEAASSQINAVTELLREHHVWAKSAPQKHMPERVFELPKQQLALFLNRLFACDGGVSISKTGQVRIAYGTASEVLAKQLQHMLLRFGILAKLRCKNHHARTQYEVEVLDRHSILIFIDQIGMIGKEERLDYAKSLLIERREHSNLDSVPDSVIQYILELKGDRSWTEIYSAKGIVLPEGFNSHLTGQSKRGLSRARCAEYAQLFDDRYLADMASSDIYWDRIVSIEYQGYKQVYDLTVPELHNFVAEDICVHNTTFAMNLVENAMMSVSKPVVVFSMEMPAEDIVKRMIGSLGRIDVKNVFSGKLTEEDWPKLSTAVRKMKDKPLYIDDSTGLSPTEIRARLRRIQREHGDVGLVMIDYLQLMKINGFSEGRTAEISEISRGLKSVAREFNCPVVALSQLNRSLEQRPNKRPINSDLRESGAIEQDADVIMFIYRDEVYNEDTDQKGIAEIIIGKQRNGPIGTCKLAFVNKYTRFENLAIEYQDDY